jgi:hypothetical protein
VPVELAGATFAGFEVEVPVLSPELGPLLVWEPELFAGGGLRLVRFGS